jgi:hypothetical protein
VGKGLDKWVLPAIKGYIVVQSGEEGSVVEGGGRRPWKTAI